MHFERLGFPSRIDVFYIFYISKKCDLSVSLSAAFSFSYIVEICKLHLLEMALLFVTLVVFSKLQITFEKHMTCLHRSFPGKHAASKRCISSLPFSISKNVNRKLGIYFREGHCCHFPEAAWPIPTLPRQGAEVIRRDPPQTRSPGTWRWRWWNFNN